MRFALVVSRFNQGVTQKLLDGAQRILKERRLPEPEVHWVPGAYELAYAAHELAKTGRFDAIVALGCVLKGKTDHNRYISEAAAHGLLQASLATGVPITFGVLTPDTMKQAAERSGNNSANKGMEATEAAIEMAAFRLKLRNALRHG